MEMQMKKVGNVVEVMIDAWGNDYLEAAPVMAKYSICPEELSWIKMAANFCRTNDVLEVVVSKSGVEYFFEDDNGDPTITVDQNGFRLDSERMMVTESTVRFVAYEKYTGLEVWVESVRIADLQAVMNGEGGHEISD